MGGRPLEGPTMVGRTLDWNDELGRWLKPFVDRLGHRARRRMCPLYVSGLIGPGDRKSVQPMAKRLVLGGGLGLTLCEEPVTCPCVALAGPSLSAFRDGSPTPPELPPFRNGLGRGLLG